MLIILKCFTSPVLLRCGPAQSKIEQEMLNIARENIPLERFVLSRKEAMEFMQQRGEAYKQELIADLPEDAEISFYRQGDFTDLCAGPHLKSTGEVKAFPVRF